MKLSAKQCAKIIELRRMEEPVTITNLAFRYGVSERTIYYILAQYRSAERAVASSITVAIAGAN